ncbi:histone-fold-containing protein [Linnemannia elongata]|uniref:Histone-fold-containing protein n=1 Tax=Linnemannia elongata AG-77 TaxID=1314771 RepID=A0A197JX29_9FUNG|nr:histone-fold-containing protein [Linnemannia elongata]KAK5815245.1 histone-fold-containing protein [Linnemannia elongata]OAQ29780.1 histone-fold-containing protein [Linnemannia elongata AG-77]
MRNKKYKTKFPVARIKKIMQMDEDVGKVAQATPILISKALELFMQSLIDEACMETRAKNAKRLTAAHLKKTILEKDQFDFLRDIVENVADPQGDAGSGQKGGSGGGGGGGGAAAAAAADFAGAMAAARKGAPAKLTTSIKGKATSKDDDDEDDDYDNE